MKIEKSIVKQILGAVLATSIGLSCAHVLPAAMCASAVVEAAIKDALANPAENWEAELDKLAIQYGASVVSCVVQEVLTDAQQGKVGDSIEISHAKVWQADRGK